MFWIRMNKMDVFWSVFNNVCFVIVIILDLFLRLHKFADINSGRISVLFQNVV